MHSSSTIGERETGKLMGQVDGLVFRIIQTSEELPYCRAQRKGRRI
jgi:hypothetical protein